VSNRREFDKKLRQAERQYQAVQRNKIKRLNTRNPKEFWREVNKLGPQKGDKAIDCVLLENRDVSYDPELIREKWKNEYSKLFTGDSMLVNDEFISNLENLNRQMEQDFETIEHLNDSELTEPTSLEVNEIISLVETKCAMRNVKLAKKQLV